MACFFSTEQLRIFSAGILGVPAELAVFTMQNFDVAKLEAAAQG
jgi:hypothetical protein